MPSQNIDLGNTDDIQYDGQAVDELVLNGNTIWQRSAWLNPTTGVGVPYWGEGGSDTYISEDTTYNGNQIIHCKSFSVAQLAKLTVNGEYIIIFATDYISISGRFYILRDNLAASGSNTAQKANKHLNISAGGGGGGSSGDGCPMGAGQAGEDYCNGWDWHTGSSPSSSSSSITPNTPRVANAYGGGGGGCNSQGGNGLGDTSTGNDIYDPGRDTWLFGQTWSDDPSSYLFELSNGEPVTSPRPPEHDKRFVGWNVPVETNSLCTSQWDESVTNRYKYLICPTTDFAKWGKKQLRIPIALGGNGGTGGLSGTGNTPGGGGAGGGCIILISPRVGVNTNASVFVGGRTGGKSTDNGAHFASGGGGGGGGGFFGVVCEEELSNSKMIQSPPSYQTWDLNSKSYSMMSYARRNRGNVQDTYKNVHVRGGAGGGSAGTHPNPWGVTYGGRGSAGQSFLKLVGYQIYEQISSPVGNPGNYDGQFNNTDFTASNGGEAKFCIVYCGLPMFDKNGNVLAIRRRTPISTGVNTDHGDLLIDYNLTESEALTRLAYYKGLSPPFLPDYNADTSIDNTIGDTFSYDNRNATPVEVSSYFTPPKPYPYWTPGIDNPAYQGYDDKIDPTATERGTYPIRWRRIRNASYKATSPSDTNLD